VGDRSCL
jgi:fructokinase